LILIEAVGRTDVDKIPSSTTFEDEFDLTEFCSATTVADVAIKDIVLVTVFKRGVELICCGESA